LPAPGANASAKPPTTLPASLRTLPGVRLKQPGGDREMAHILARVLQHDEPLVEQAVRQALEGGVPTKTHVLNRLSRSLDTPPVAHEPPPALTVNDEPRANTER
jgi:hypothetical protein